MPLSPRPAHRDPAVPDDPPRRHLAVTPAQYRPPAQQLRSPPHPRDARAADRRQVSSSACGPGLDGWWRGTRRGGGERNDAGGLGQRRRRTRPREPRVGAHRPRRARMGGRPRVARPARRHRWRKKRARAGRRRRRGEARGSSGPWRARRHVTRSPPASRRGTAGGAAPCRRRRVADPLHPPLGAGARSARGEAGTNRARAGRGAAECDVVLVPVGRRAWRAESKGGTPM